MVALTCSSWVSDKGTTATRMGGEPAPPRDLFLASAWFMKREFNYKRVDFNGKERSPTDQETGRLYAMLSFKELNHLSTTMIVFGSLQNILLL